MKRYLGNGLEAEIVEEGVIIIDKYQDNISIFIRPDVWKNLKEFMERSKEQDKSDV